jgi:GMP synthase-like glutamine amidotransferase
MAGAEVAFVITEHPTGLTLGRERHFERIRGVLEEIAGVPVRSRRYVDVERLEGAMAVVLSGSFASWAEHDPAALARLGQAIQDYGGPVLGICAGMQLQVMFAGGAIVKRERPEMGFGPIEVLESSDLMRGVGSTLVAYKHHSEDVTELPEGFTVLARSESCRIEAIAAQARRWWGTQFHPEEYTEHHPAGARILANFFELAGVRAQAG